jgi:hypothetical protein
MSATGSPGSNSVFSTITSAGAGGGGSESGNLVQLKSWCVRWIRWRFRKVLFQLQIGNVGGTGNTPPVSTSTR